MSINEGWKTNFINELETAKVAREAGNEGKARVCARRAAGIAIGEYLYQKKLPTTGPSAYDRLVYIATLPGLSARVRRISEHLTLRVNEDFKLPIKADLISECYELVELLLGETLKEE